MKYKRVLIKISGEVLAGQQSGGWDFKVIREIAAKIKAVKLKHPKLQIAIVIGAGNLARGSQISPMGLDRVDADYIGMLGTVMNSMLVSDVFNSEGLDTRALSAISVDEAIDGYTPRRATSHLNKNRIVIIAGGTGRPHMTTDTAGVLASLELKSDAIFKATKVNGVYDSDPATNNNAKKFEKLSLNKALELGEVKVMDKAALGMAAESNLPIIIFKLSGQDSINEALNHNPEICTVIS
jgi:uridylate kinase